MRLMLRWLPLGSLCVAAILNAQAPASPPQPAPGNSQDNPYVQPPGVVTTACPQPLAHQTPGSVVTSGDWVELQRTGCLGACPAYTVRLYAGGTVHWHGDGFVTVRGDAAAQVDAAQAANLIQQLRDHGFESLCGSYSRPITDNAAYITTVSVAGRAVRVSDYADSAPAWLRDFDDRIDAAADTHRWRHGEPSSELFGDQHIQQDARFPKPGRTQLMHAAGTPNGAIQLLLAQQVPVDAEDASGWTALMYAAADGSLRQVRQLLAAGADASHRSRAGESLLFAAAESADNPVNKLIVLQKAGANVAAGTNDGTTVLMMAVSRYWQPEILRTVLSLGADPRVRNSQGKTALDLLEQAWQGLHQDDPAAYDIARQLLLKAH
jgi:hypothetical protein